MNGYKHAVTTAKSRALIVKRYESGWRQQRVAECFGISRRTMCKWLKRWENEGESGLRDRAMLKDMMIEMKPDSAEQPAQLVQVMDQFITDAARAQGLPNIDLPPRHC